MRHWVSFLTPVSTARSTDGAPVVTYTTALSCWARVDPLGGTEQFRGDYRWTDSDTRFVIRFSTVSITPRNLVVFNGSTYDIQGVTDSSAAGRELVIMARVAT